MPKITHTAGGMVQVSGVTCAVSAFTVEHDVLPDDRLRSIAAGAQPTADEWRSLYQEGRRRSPRTFAVDDLPAVPAAGEALDAAAGIARVLLECREAEGDHPTPPAEAANEL